MITPTIDTITLAVCRRLAVRPEELRSRRRTATVVLARHMIAIIAHKILRLSMQEIAANFGQTPAAALYGIDRMLSLPRDPYLLIPGTRMTAGQIMTATDEIAAKFKTESARNHQPTRPMEEPEENIPGWENHLIRPLAKLMMEKGISDLQITLKDGKAIYVLDPANDQSGVPVATTYTKSYVSGEFGDTSKPLDYITLKAGDRELAMLPLREIAYMATELREEIERYRMEHKPDTRHSFVPNKKYPWFCRDCGYPPEHPVMHLPAAASLDSENVRPLATADNKTPDANGNS